MKREFLAMQAREREENARWAEHMFNAEERRAWAEKGITNPSLAALALAAGITLDMVAPRTDDFRVNANEHLRLQVFCKLHPEVPGYIGQTPVWAMLASGSTFDDVLSLSQAEAARQDDEPRSRRTA